MTQQRYFMVPVQGDQLHISNIGLLFDISPIARIQMADCHVYPIQEQCCFGVCVCVCLQRERWELEASARGTQPSKTIPKPLISLLMRHTNSPRTLSLSPPNTHMPRCRSGFLWNPSHKSHIWECMTSICWPPLPYLFSFHLLRSKACNPAEMGSVGGRLTRENIFSESFPFPLLPFAAFEGLGRVSTREGTFRTWRDPSLPPPPLRQHTFSSAVY